MSDFSTIAFDFGSLIPAIVVAVLAAALPELYRFLAKHFLKRVKKHMAPWLHILLESFVLPFAMILRIWLILIAIALLPFAFIHGDKFQTMMDVGSDLLIIFYLGLGSWRAAPVTRLLLHSAENRLDLQTHKTMGRFFENIFHALVIMFTGIAMLDRLGVPVGGLLTGAGVAGLAISLAAQSTLSNLIAGVTLVLEHPFGIGDYIVVGNYEGKVEDVSFRSTRIRTLDNVAITIENSKICSEYIQNCDRRESRLWTFTIGLTYDTTHEKLDTLCAKITETVQAHPDVLPNGVSVTLDKFNDYSIDLLCRVYIMKIPLGEFLQVKNELNFEILDLVRSEGCEFAFPTTTVEMAK